MKIEERIEKMKKVYRETPVSDEHIAKEWQLLEGMLGEQHQSRVSPHFFRTFAFLAVVLLLSGGVVTVAQASKPGELLYPVKEFSQKVVEEVKQSVPVFVNPTPTVAPTVTPTIENEEKNDVKGVQDKKKINDYEEKNENSSWNNAGGRSEEKEEQKSENGNNRDNHSGSDNSNNNNQSENGKKENSPNSEKVEKNNSEHQGNANGKSPKK